MKSSAGRLAFVLACSCACVAISTTSVVSLPRGLRVQVYRAQLEFPVDMAWPRNSNVLFFTERATGKVRILVGRRLLRRPCVDLDVDSTDGRGALGVAVHPQFDRNHFLYVYYTNESPLENRVTRFEVRRNQCRRPRDIILGIPSHLGFHQGGQLEFLQGKLFVTTGDGGSPSSAQSLDSPLGKILRYNPDGSIPRGNPFSQPGHPSPVWSYGHRNPFGLTHRPGTTKLYSSENGPDCDDEINLVIKGRNYGWGDEYQCGTVGVGDNPKPPLFRWSKTVAPTDVTWYEGELGPLSGSLYVGDFNTHSLHRFILNRRGTRVSAYRRTLTGSPQITSVTEGPEGYLYFSTKQAIYRVVRR